MYRSQTTKQTHQQSNLFCGLTCRIVGLSPLRVAKDPNFFRRTAKTDQAGQMSILLILDFAVCTCHFVGSAMLWHPQIMLKCGDWCILYVQTDRYLTAILSVCLYIYTVIYSFLLPPTLKKFEGHIAFGLPVRLFIRTYVTHIDVCHIL